MDPSGLLTAAASSVVREIAQQVTRSVRDCFKAGGAPWTWSEEAIGRHLLWLSSWSAVVQIGDMRVPESVEKSSIPLALVSGSPAYVDAATQQTISERDLLAIESSHLLLGEPGSGKTTSIKRLCRLLIGEPQSPEDTCQYPIVVVLRDLRTMEGSGFRFETLSERLATILGLDFNAHRDTTQGGSEVRCGSETLIAAIVRCLDATGAVVLADGLDELEHEQHRRSVESEIQYLCHSLQRAKLIVSVRAGAVGRVLENMHKVEIQPLSPAQRQQLATAWLQDRADLFFEELEQKPYRDLAGRPLFLVRLMLLYRRERTLPAQPFEVYEPFVMLLLENWDKERDITRMSRYAAFGPYQKLRFLAALSYHLLINRRSVRFTTFQLGWAYVELSPQFQLPAADAETVVKEIASHTGLIVAFPNGGFEFSHLSLQEYLCGYHFLRTPFPQRLKEYLSGYPAPVAIAVAMSADPGEFLGSIVLTGTESDLRSSGFGEFLHRLFYERPHFSAGPIFGLSMLHIVSNRPEAIRDVNRAAMTNTDAAVLTQSVLKALEAYVLVRITSDRVLIFEKYEDIRLPAPLLQPTRLAFSESFLLDLLPPTRDYLRGRTSAGDIVQLAVSRDRVAFDPS